MERTSEILNHRESTLAMEHIEGIEASIGEAFRFQIASHRNQASVQAIQEPLRDGDAKQHRGLANLVAEKELGSTDGLAEKASEGDKHRRIQIGKLRAEFTDPSSAGIRGRAEVATG